MRNVSSEFKTKMQTNTRFLQHAEITLANNTVLQLDSTDFTVTENSYTDGAGISSFPLVVAVMRYISLSLVNSYSSYDFVGARIRLYLTFQLTNSVETVELGRYTATTPASYGTTVNITAYDDMYKADKVYDPEDLTFPATAGNTLAAICTLCGITLASSTFTRASFQITEAPVSGCTYRQIVACIALIAGGNARINDSGQLEIISYATHSSGDPLLQSWNRLTVGTEDLTITGIHGNIVKVGTDGYVIGVDVNGLSGQEAEILTAIEDDIVGLSFRTFDGDHISNPILEFMDSVLIKDRNGDTYSTYITDVTFEFCGFTSIKNSAESTMESNGMYLSAAKNEAGRIMVVLDELAADLINVGLLVSTAQSTADGAASAASAAQTAANGANSQEQLVYRSATSGTTSVNPPTTWITSSTDSQNTWGIKRPTYSSSYPVLFVATQRKAVDGTVTCTTPIKDDTTTVIDGGHITTGTIDASTVTVTNINANNITSGTINGSNVNVKNLNVIDGSGNVISTYSGSGITLGQTSQSNMKLDSRSFKLVDKDGHTFLEARDLRNASGIAEVVDYFVGDGNSTTFYLSATPIGSVSVTIDSVATSAYTITDDTVLRFNQAPRTGAEIRVAYNGDSMSLVEMTLGGRNDSYPVGATSFTVGSGNAATGPYTRAFGFDTRAHGYYSGAEGSNTVALGYASHAEGTETNASGDSSHAEGYGTDAPGNASHAEGTFTNASGDSSHAEGYGTDASGFAQTSLGKYNILDLSGTYAVIIGNGSSNSSRSNALTVDWSGNVNTSGNVTANGVSVSELNRKALGIRGQIGALSSWNIDNMASNENYGTWWLNIDDSDITGTKPTSSGQGLLFCKRQSSGISRQYYRGVTARGNYYRYYTHSTGVWTAWEPVPGIPLIESFTGTTSANGNFSHTFSKNVVVLSAWANTSDKIVSAYPSGGTTTGGATTWWFHVRNANANGTVVASTSTTVTVSYMYI